MWTPPLGGCTHRRLHSCLMQTLTSLMNCRRISSIWFGVAAGFLVWTGAGEWSSQSNGAPSWDNKTSFAALQLRAQGKLKVGLGIGFFALALAGKSWGSGKNPEPLQPLTAIHAPKPPRSKLSTTKVVYGGNSECVDPTMPVKTPTFKKG